MFVQRHSISFSIQCYEPFVDFFTPSQKVKYLNKLFNCIYIISSCFKKEKKKESGSRNNITLKPYKLQILGNDIGPTNIYHIYIYIYEYVRLKAVYTHIIIY